VRRTTNHSLLSIPVLEWIGRVALRHIDVCSAFLHPPAPEMRRVILDGTFA